MPSKIHEAALHLDLTAALFRFSVTHDADEITDLLPEQLLELAKRFPVDSEEYVELHELIKHKATAP